MIKTRWIKGAWLMTRGRKKGQRVWMKSMKEPAHHPDWINDIRHQWVLYRVGFWGSLCSVTHNHKSVYHKRSHWMVRVNWLKSQKAHQRISRVDAEFLLALSRPEAIEQLEAIYGSAS